MHAKGSAIAPPMHSVLGLTVETCTGIDTDTLGTFSGEVPRRGTMGEVAIQKARMGMAAADLPLGLASEGSFGPHPHVPFLSAGMELLVLVDDERGFTVSESLVAEQTNFAHALVRGTEELESFLGRVQFPSHALVVEPHPRRDETMLCKGIVTHAALSAAVRACVAASAEGVARVQTDMRAHLNPTRMAAIGMLAQRLAARLAMLCPACNTPGFGRVDVERGLPCEACGAPTDWVAAEIFGCAVCPRRERRPRPEARTSVGPECCPLCNP